MKTRLFLVPWGTVAEECLELSRVPYLALICDTKWDAGPLAFQNLDFSHSLEGSDAISTFALETA